MEFSMSRGDNNPYSEYSRTIVINGENGKFDLNITLQGNVISMWVDAENEVSTSSTNGDIDIICTNEPEEEED